MTLVGVGLSLEVDNEGLFRIKSLSPNHPVNNSPLQLHDELIRIDGRDLLGMTLAQVSSLMAGPAESTISVKARSATTRNKFVCKLVRQEAHRPSEENLQVRSSCIPEISDAKAISFFPLQRHQADENWQEEKCHQQLVGCEQTKDKLRADLVSVHQELLIAQQNLEASGLVKSKYEQGISKLKARLAQLDDELEFEKRRSSQWKSTAIGLPQLEEEVHNLSLTFEAQMVHFEHTISSLIKQESELRSILHKRIEDEEAIIYSLVNVERTKIRNTLLRDLLHQISSCERMQEEIYHLKRSTGDEIEHFRETHASELDRAKQNWLRQEERLKSIHAEKEDMLKYVYAHQIEHLRMQLAHAHDKAATDESALRGAQEQIERLQSQKRDEEIAQEGVMREIHAAHAQVLHNLRQKYESQMLRCGRDVTERDERIQVMEGFLFQESELRTQAHARDLEELVKDHEAHVRALQQELEQEKSSAANTKDELMKDHERRLQEAHAAALDRTMRDWSLHQEMRESTYVQKKERLRSLWHGSHSLSQKTLEGSATHVDGEEGESSGHKAQAEAEITQPLVEERQDLETQLTISERSLAVCKKQVHELLARIKDLENAKSACDQEVGRLRFQVDSKDLALRSVHARLQEIMHENMEIAQELTTAVDAYQETQRLQEEVLTASPYNRELTAERNRHKAETDALRSLVKDRLIRIQDLEAQLRTHSAQAPQDLDERLERRVEDASVHEKGLALEKRTEIETLSKVHLKTMGALLARVENEKMESKAAMVKEMEEMNIAAKSECANVRSTGNEDLKRACENEVRRLCLQISQSLQRERDSKQREDSKDFALRSIQVCLQEILRETRELEHELTLVIDSQRETEHCFALVITLELEYLVSSIMSIKSDISQVEDAILGPHVFDNSLGAGLQSWLSNKTPSPPSLSPTFHNFIRMDEFGATVPFCKSDNQSPNADRWSLSRNGPAEWSSWRSQHCHNNSGSLQIEALDLKADNWELTRALQERHPIALRQAVDESEVSDLTIALQERYSRGILAFDENHTSSRTAKRNRQIEHLRSKIKSLGSLPDHDDGCHRYSPLAHASSSSQVRTVDSLTKSPNDTRSMQYPAIDYSATIRNRVLSEVEQANETRDLEKKMENTFAELEKSLCARDDLLSIVQIQDEEVRRLRSDLEHVATLCVSTTELRQELEQGLLALEIEFEEQDMVILRQGEGLKHARQNLLTELNQAEEKSEVMTQLKQEMAQLTAQVVMLKTELVAAQESKAAMMVEMDNLATIAMQMTRKLAEYERDEAVAILICKQTRKKIVERCKKLGFRGLFHNAHMQRHLMMMCNYAFAQRRSASNMMMIANAQIVWSSWRCGAVETAAGIKKECRKFQQLQSFTKRRTYQAMVTLFNTWRARISELISQRVQHVHKIRLMQMKSARMERKTVLLCLDVWYKYATKEMRKLNSISRMLLRMKDRFYYLVFIHWAYSAEKQKREKAVNRLEESRQNNLRKENCIKALTDLRTCLETELDSLRRQRMGLIQEHNNVVDAQQQEIETVLAISQHDNLEKEKYIQELHGNLEELTAELGALRQTKDLMHELHTNALAEVKQLKEDIIREQKDSSQLEQAVDDLTRRLLQEQKDSNDLEEAVDGLTKRLMNTEDKLAKMTVAHGALNDLLGIRSEYSENLVGSANSTHHLLQHTRCRACDAAERERRGESQTGL